MIDPNAITTVRVGELASAPLNLTDNIPHEVGTELKRGTIQDLVTFVQTAIGAGSGVGFLSIAVTDGQQLPAVPAEPSFFLAGQGTYLNINGYPDLVCTDELNAIISLSDHWEIGVQIPINADFPPGTANYIAKFSGGFVTESQIIDNGARVLIGTDVDNGVNTLQVDGSISASALNLFITPSVSAGTYDILTRNDTTGELEIITGNPVPTLTSDLTNDGEDGVNPFITALDIPATPDLNTVMGVGNFTEENLQFQAGAGFQYLDSTFTSQINTVTLSANRGIDFPNKSGVIAMTTDIITDLSYTPSPTDGTVLSSNGTDATLPLADGTNAGLLKPGKFTVLENTSGTNTGDQDLSGLALKAIQVTGQNLSSASWTLVGGFYEYNLANANITTTSIVDIIPDNGSVSVVQAAQFLPATLSGSGTVKMYATNLPTVNIVVTINIWK